MTGPNQIITFEMTDGLEADTFPNMIQLKQNDFISARKTQDMDLTYVIFGGNVNICNENK